MLAKSGWQKTGSWTLSVLNDGIAPVEIQDFAISLRGSFSSRKRALTSWSSSQVETNFRRLARSRNSSKSLNFPDLGSDFGPQRLVKTRPTRVA